VRIILTGGERNDITQIEPLLAGMKAGFVLADKAYDAQRAADAILACHAVAVIPNRVTATVKRPFDQTIYKKRNLIERFFCKLKHFRRIATRYDKLARNYKSFLCLVATLKWII